MADIALVHLALDSSGVVAGEKQATRSLKNVSDSADKATQSLQNIGGPVGRLASSFGNLTGSASSLVSGLGLIGTGAAIAATAVAALGAALLKAAIDGGKLADEIVDLAGLTGVQAQTLEALQAGYAGLGGSAQNAQQAIGRFSNQLGQAASGEVPKMEAALKALGVVNFDDVDASLKAVLKTLSENENATETNAVATRLFGREGVRLVAVYRDLNDANSELNQNLQKFGLTLGTDVLTNASKVGDQLDLMAFAFDQLKIKIAAELMPTIVNFGTTFLQIFKNLEPVILATARLLDAVLTPLTTALTIRGLPQQRAGLTTTSVGGAEVQFDPSKFPAGFGPNKGAGGGVSATGRALADLIGKSTATHVKAAGGGGGAGVSLPGGAGISFEQALALVAKGMDLVEERAQGVANGLAAMNARMLEILGARAELIRQGVPFPLQPGLIQQGGPGQPFPGAPIFGGLPRPQDIRTEEQARLDEQFSLIFDDMLISILTAQKTVGESFAGLALGIVDTFAIEFTKALRESFVTPVIRQLTDFLQSALQDLFGGLSAGGLKGAFGGIVKGIGTIFGGFFASGGTLGPGKFGVAGERGPELIFAGNQPMHIAPVTAGSAGNVFNISVGVNAPSGTVDKRTQDQLAVTVMNAVKRAQRNEGAR